MRNTIADILLVVVVPSRSKRNVLPSTATPPWPLLWPASEDLRRPRCCASGKLGALTLVQAGELSMSHMPIYACNMSKNTHTGQDNDKEREISERHKNEQYRDSNMAPWPPSNLHISITTTPSCMQHKPSRKTSGSQLLTVSSIGNSLAV
jgi:hypothetical protein